MSKDARSAEGVASADSEKRPLTKGRAARWQPSVRHRDDSWSPRSSWSSCPGAPDPPRAPLPARGQQPRARSPTAGPATAEPVPDVMTGGRYVFRPLADEPPSLEIVATGPDGWVGYPSWAMDGPEPVRVDAPTGIGISFFSAEMAYTATRATGTASSTGRADTRRRGGRSDPSTTWWRRSAPTPSTRHQSRRR